jgi:asparagine synthase (glutamine-hydrolysing)
MSGIFGIYYCDQRPAKPDDLQPMLDILAHRGSDGADIWWNGPVGLGHRMLWSTPESLLEKLPAVKGSLTITADARIDNRDELIASLVLNSLPPEKITDSDIILAAYAQWGEACPEKLLGDFAFAIWDGDKQQLFCARDHFGVKPFYYYASELCVVFATEIKAIFCIPEVPRQLNEVRVGDYLLSMFHDVAITSYQNIFRLPPANTITINANGIKLKQYWALDPDRELPPASNEEYAAQFREIFTQAVDCRLRSAYELGTTLSGGLDSSSITGTARNLMANQGRQSLHTFSAVFDELADCDERKYIEPILAQGGLKHHYVQGDKISPLEQIDKMFWHQDEAFCAPNWFMNWPLYGEIQQQGVRVVLDGFDGDTTVSDGYGYLSELARADRWLAFAGEIRRLAKAFGGSFWQMLWSYVHQYRVKPLIARFRLLRIIRKVGQGALRLVWQESPPSVNSSAGSPFIDPEFSRRMHMMERHQGWRKTQGHSGLHERERHYRNIAKQGLPPFALEVMDKSMAAFGLEPRYPFWDKRLVEFCLALPSNQKLNQGWNRVVMRRAMSGILPIEVQWRMGKTDFSPNLTEGLVGDRPRLDKAIAQLGTLKHSLDVKAVEEIYQRFLAEPSHGGARQLWTVLSLSLWLNYIAKQGVVNQDIVDQGALSLESLSKGKSKVSSSV